MIKQLSFTKYEHKILPNFRQMISKAESTEDVKKFFVCKNIWKRPRPRSRAGSVAQRQQRASSSHE